ncbi:MAG: short-chain dehydrogenase [Gemmatimonadota bacterium]|nr:short-chain dehydrogenase [Gemmatimonadota bacterium]
MDLRNATVLLLGGSGLVGSAIARRMLAFAPRRLIVTGLGREETEATAAEVRSHVSPGLAVVIDAAWGNIFLPRDLAQRPRAELLADPSARRRVVDDILRPSTPDGLEQHLLHDWLVRDRPDVVVDCVNTATALAYQDVFASSAGLLSAAEAGTLDIEMIERHILTIPLPQLIRHMEVLVDGMRTAGTRAYVKIGTSGTGGMGLNIPYTHSEQRPSRNLLSKSGVAGAQSLFLFLLGRTPGAPATIEIKPTAAIAWKEIGYGVIRRGGRVLELVDCEQPIALDRAFRADAAGWSCLGIPLESVFINVGENGFFARDEFETVSALGQMELVTPEEIAEAVVMELQGQSTGKDIVAALDGATFGPTYRGGYLRACAVDGLRALEQQHGVRSIGFEMLGPPRLTKLLYEAHILSLLHPTVRALAGAVASDLSRDAEALLRHREPQLRRQILSVGLPILLSDGRSVLRGSAVVVPPDGRGADMASRGWVDLRAGNMEHWVNRAKSIASVPHDRSTGSSARWTAVNPDSPIEPSRLAVWIFEKEDGGFRVKR